MASPTLGRRGGLKALQDMPMPSLGEVEKEWTRLAEMSGLKGQGRTPEDKWRLICEANVLMGLSAEDYVRYVGQAAKKPGHHEVGVYAGLSGRAVEWLEEAVGAGLLGPLGRLLREASEEGQLRDCVQSLYLMCGFDAGLLGLGRDARALAALLRTTERLPKGEPFFQLSSGLRDSTELCVRGPGAADGAAGADGGGAQERRGQRGRGPGPAARPPGPAAGRGRRPGHAQVSPDPAITPVGA
jgi:hypothetical protein